MQLLPANGQCSILAFAFLADSDSTGKATPTFRTSGIGLHRNILLVPFYKVFDQRYAVYWKMQSPYYKQVRLRGVKRVMKNRRKKQAQSQEVPYRSHSTGPMPALKQNLITNNKYLVAFWIPLALIAINLFVYYQVQHFEFIGGDDPLYVSQNAVISKGLTWRGIQWAFSTVHLANWHPLTWISHMIDVQLFGVAAGPHHFINVLFHIANSLLLFWVLFRMTAACGQSAFVAGLFAVHPLHVESVAWIAERKDVLSTLLFLLTIFAYLAYLRRPVPRRYLLVAGSFALALMAKPMIVTLPFVLLLLDIWPLRRITLGGGQRQAWIQLIREKAPLIAMAIVSSAITIMVQWRYGSVPDANIYPLSMRIANVPFSYIAYIGQMLWPKNLCLFYPIPEHSLPALWVAGCIVGLACSLIAAVWLARRHPYLLVGLLWYMGTLVPVIGLIQAGSQARADRFTYIPLIGIFIVAAWGIPNLLSGWRHRKIFLAAGAGIIICALAITARVQAGYWSNAIIPWEHALESTTDNYYACVNAGLAVEGRGETARAIDYYREALRLNPNYAIAHNALGVALLRQRQVEPAIDALNNAIRLQPDFGQAHSNLGVAFMELGKTDEAISHFEAAVKADPNDARSYYNLGIALAKAGKIDEAFARFAEALERAPYFIEVYLQRGDIFFALGKPDEAIAQYRKAIHIDPHEADLHQRLAFVLMNQGRFDEAIAEFREVLKIRPERADAHTSLGNALLYKKQEEEAIAQYLEALRLNPDDTVAHYNLGIAYVNRKRYEEAVFHFSEVVRLKPGDLDARNKLSFALKSRDAQANHSQD